MNPETHAVTRLARPTLMALCLVAGALAAACTGSGNSNPEADGKARAGAAAPAELCVGVAASLQGAFRELAERFEQGHPGVRVRIRSGGSTALARKALDLGLDVDVLALADARLFERMLLPQWTDFYVRFASERIVLAMNPNAAGAGRISTENWWEVLTTEDVKIAMADPDQAPVGYRTLMTLRLADKLHPGARIEQRIRERIGEANIRADVAELIAPVQAGAVDYAFLYGATAEGADLKFIELPAKVNLGDPAEEEFYARVSVETRGEEPGTTVLHRGGAIVYGASVATKARAPELANEFLTLLISGEGKAVLRRFGFSPVERRDLLLSGNVPGKPAEGPRAESPGSGSPAQAHP